MNDRSICFVEADDPGNPVFGRSNMAAAANFDCTYSFFAPDDPVDGWRAKLPAACERVVAHLRTLKPGQPRCVHPIWLWTVECASKSWDGRMTPAPDFSRPLPTGIATEQVRALATALYRSGQATPTRMLDLLSIDHEESLPFPDDQQRRADGLRVVTAPLRAVCADVVNYAFGTPCPEIPALCWSGAPIGVGAITETSSCEGYCSDWPSFIRCRNGVRSCLRMGPAVTELPAVCPDPARARAMTRASIIHDRLAGVTRFVWAAYMTPPAEQPLMAEVIGSSMEVADLMARRRRVWLKRQRPGEIDPAAPEVVTAAYRTGVEEFAVAERYA